MVELPQNLIPELYGQLMGQIKVRSKAGQDALEKAYHKEGGDDAAYLQFEFSVLQVRRITELVALATLVAHNEIEDFRTKDLSKEWNAGALVSRLTRLSENAFPWPLDITSIDSDEMEVTLVDTPPLTKADLATIYAECGGILHTGSLKDLSRGKKTYDIPKVQGWYRDLIALLDRHIIVLPGTTPRRAMIVLMAQGPEGMVHCRLTNLIPKMLA